MKILKRDVVTRYSVTFTPGETKKLLAHPTWQHVIGVSGRRNHVGAATLTKKQINEVCDVLGVNGREFMARYETERVVSERAQR